MVLQFTGSRQVKIFHKSDIGFALPQKKVPSWLSEVAETSGSYGNRKAPMKNILSESLFYPGCGVDGRIVKYMSGCVHSFIYVDYSFSRPFILERFFGKKTVENKHAGVTGYHCILEKDISREEIALPGWRPQLCPPESMTHLPYPAHAWAKYFGHWTVWQRDSDRDDGHGPELFSFIYLSGEACAIYETLYNRLGIAPLVIAFVQVGGMDGGWTSMTHGSYFYNTLKNNTDGMPLFQISAGTGNGFVAFNKPCFPEYCANSTCAPLGLFPLEEEFVIESKKKKFLEEIRQWKTGKI